LNIGAGTVCNLNDLRIALAAGARFIVTPVVNQKVIEECVHKGIPVFPGALTPSEVYNAHSFGAAGVKVFPAGPLGPQYIRNILGPFQNIKLFPTGGVNLDNCLNFLESGAYGVGIGGELFRKDLINKKDWKELGIHFSTLVKRVKQDRHST
jgi:2-dehydro-3-deoxyphosphogluconate aldolase/(4S)-4-hydroxy-2-oxoglutarate aldolase